MTTANAIGIHLHLALPYAEAIALVTDALKVEGFGVLTEIDVRETFKKKLNQEFRPYKILGACNPPLAFRALSAAPEVGLLLPCNVTVSQADDGGSDVSLVDPISMLGVVTNPALEPIAADARARLERVAKSLEG